MGYLAGQNLTTGGDNINVATANVAGESNTIRIGNVAPFTDIYGYVHPAHAATYIAGISGATVSGTAVVVDGTCRLGVAPSS